VSLFVEPLPARVIAMTPKPSEAIVPAAEAKPELKLVAPLQPAQPRPDTDPTVPIKPLAGAASAAPEAKPPEAKPAGAAPAAPAKDEVKS
jgi:hypothetical protein